MARRIQSRNQGVCDTINPIAKSATAIVPSQAAAWMDRRIKAIGSKCLSDAEVDA
jgi:hypothetical protein